MQVVLRKPRDVEKGDYRTAICGVTESSTVRHGSIADQKSFGEQHCDYLHGLFLPKRLLRYGYGDREVGDGRIGIRISLDRYIWGIFSKGLYFERIFGHLAFLLLSQGTP